MTAVNLLSVFMIEPPARSVLNEEHAVNKDGPFKCALRPEPYQVQGVPRTLRGSGRGAWRIAECKSNQNRDSWIVNRVSVWGTWALIDT